MRVHLRLPEITKYTSAFLYQLTSFYCLCVRFVLSPFLPLSMCVFVSFYMDSFCTFMFSFNGIPWKKGCLKRERKKDISIHKSTADWTKSFKKIQHLSIFVWIECVPFEEFRCTAFVPRTNQKTKLKRWYVIIHSVEIPQHITENQNLMKSFVRRNEKKKQLPTKRCAQETIWLLFCK